MQAENEKQSPKKKKKHAKSFELEPSSNKIQLETDNDPEQ